MSATFPREDDLCERCGYPLRGVAPDAACPECGHPAAQSDPARRPGLAWQRRRTPLAWLATTRDMLLRPRVAIAAMSMSLGGDIAFLLLITLLVALLWAGIGWVSLPRQPIRFGLIAAALVIVLSYIEMAGVTFWSRRKGLRISWAVAQRVVCYAAAAWLPAALILAKAWLLKQYFFVGQAWWIGAWSQTVLGPDLTYLIAVGTVAGLWFETLVWYGVRTLRYVNHPPK